MDCNVLETVDLKACQKSEIILDFIRTIYVFSYTVKANLHYAIKSDACLCKQLEVLNKMEIESGHSKINCRQSANARCKHLATSRV